MFGRGSALMKSDEEWCRMIQYSSYLTKCREGSPQLPHASSRKCPVCGIEKPLTVDNFQIVPSFQKGFSYYCNDCDPESRKQKTITPEEFNLFLKMKRKRRWEAKFVILSWFYLLFILSSRYGLIPQAGGFGGDGALRQSDAEWCSRVHCQWHAKKRHPPKILQLFRTFVFYGSSAKHSLHLVLTHGWWEQRFH